MKSRRSPKLRRHEGWNSLELQWTLGRTALPTAMLVDLGQDPAVRMDTGLQNQQLSAVRIDTGLRNQQLSGSLVTP